MSNIRRITGRSGYIHIIKRGINHQDIFIEEEDYRYFLNTIRELKTEMDFDIVAYCLMSNHVHLLIHDENLQFSKMIQRLMTRYAMHFNRKYKRTGPLCEGRYTGRTIENERYLLTAVRYIHNNPISAGISLPEDYKWCSYREYIGGVQPNNIICDTKIIIGLFSSIDYFIEFHRSNLDAGDYKQIREIESLEGKKEISDSEIRALIKNITGFDAPYILQTLSQKDRDRVVKRLKKLHIPYSQLVRVTGLSLGIILRA